MTVPSYQFLAFALMVALVVRLIRFEPLRNVAILTANVLFLASFAGSPVLFIPFAGFVLFGFAVMRALQSKRVSTLWIWVAATVLLFCWIKRYSVVPPLLFIPGPYVTVGLSYIFFRMLSLIIDVGQGATTKRIGLLEYLNYTLNFTCITAGPIQLYEDYLHAHIPFSAHTLGVSAERITRGLFKVLIVSEVLNAFLHHVIASAAEPGDFATRSYYSALLVSIYPFFLYFNFSGYTDFVIGCAALMGLRLPENFDRPFTSRSFIEFWSRWHISLSNWLKTYVYNPLLSAMLRRIESASIGPFLAVIAFFVTFFLVGAWHGQTSEFLFFGLLQGGGVSVNKLYQVLALRWLGRQGYKALAANPLYAAICRGLTFAWFGFSLLWFWSNWDQLREFVGQLGAVSIVLGVLEVVVVATLALQLWVWVHDGALQLRVRGSALVESRYLRTALCTAAVAALLFTGVVLNAPAPEIVYKTF